jgi:hypothetical protein
MVGSLKKIVVHVLAVSLVGLGSPLVAQAEIITTLEGIESSRTQTDLARINAAMAREQVREQMRALGVDEAQVHARLARLTEVELQTLADRLDSLPAGAGVREVVGIVFIVLLILEAVGVTDIFKKFP